MSPLAERLRATIFLTTVLAGAALAGPANAAIDMTGSWLVHSWFLPPEGDVWDVVQSGGSLTLNGWSGSIDTVTGVFHVTPSPSMFCPPGALDGTASADNKTFTGSGYSPSGIMCHPVGFGLTGSRCGNGILDAGEQCEDGNADSGDCCSSTCQLDIAGTACTSDDDDCTTDVCDGAGACEHPFNTAPCTDAVGCVRGTCADGTCVLGGPSPLGAPCDLDSSVCTTDGCDGAGACAAGPPLDCSPCGICDAQEGCIADPSPPSCEIYPGGFSLSMSDEGGSKKRLAWKWKKETSLADFGEPTVATDYTICLYAYGLPSGYGKVILSATAPAAGTCHGAPCWTADDRGFRYKDSELDPEGISSLKLTASSSIALKGKGENLPLPSPLPVGLYLETRLFATNGIDSHCWYHSIGEPKVSTPTRYKVNEH